MPSCLGMYVQDNLIKYAKVSKDHDKIKVDSFGVKFYENINEAIKQVVEETYSYKTPISINLEQEIYNYFDMFALLNKTDLQKAIKTEFDAFCQDKGYNPNAFEKRSAVVPNIDDKQKLKVIHVSENKIEFSKMLQLFSGYKLAAVSPISMTISNLKEFEPKQNYLIVNIEDQTTVTTIIDQQIYNIETIPQGSKEFLEKLNMIENSYSKAYETCKNTTIYTSEGRELQDIENSHLEEIMPTLYSIVSQIQKIINSNTAKIEKVYITGTAALINNIDLYFQEYLEDTKCEILKPSFITNTKDINIKDLEVRKEIACGDIIIKLYTPPVKQRYNRNITGENIDGEILWQIEDVRPNVDSPFMNIILYDEKKIEAYNWEGVFYYVHIYTGKVESIPNQRPW